MTTCSKIILQNIPMPYTVNKGFFISRGRIIKSREAREFDKALLSWVTCNNLLSAIAASKAQGWVADGMLLQVNLTFFFKKERLFSKSRRAKDFVKQIDVNNRIKPALDAVSRIICIDDKFFWSHFVTKNVTTFPEHFSAEILPLKLDLPVLK